MSLPTKPADRKATPITTGVLDYFPDAIAEVARVSKAGNDQHNPGQPLHWDRSKSTDHADCIARHLLERGTIDTDGQRHSAKVAWRALALLQTELDAEAEKEFYEDLAYGEPPSKVELEEDKEFSIWPDSPGIWAWGKASEPNRIGVYRYRATDRVMEGSGYFVIESIEGPGIEKPILLVPPGSVATGEEVVFGGDLGEVVWSKVGELETPEPAAVDDGVNYEAEQNGNDGIVDWPNRPGIWGYFFNEGDRAVGRTTPERYAVKDDATHGGDYLLRRIPTGEFLRRNGSQDSLAVAEFGPNCVGWKFIEKLT